MEIKILFNFASTIIDVNDKLTDALPHQRSIRQGCPIAPALFIIHVDALHYILRSDLMTPQSLEFGYATKISY